MGSTSLCYSSRIIILFMSYSMCVLIQFGKALKDFMEEQGMHGFKASRVHIYVCSVSSSVLNMQFITRSDLDEPDEADGADCQAPHGHSGAVEVPQRAGSGEPPPQTNIHCVRCAWQSQHASDSSFPKPNTPNIVCTISSPVWAAGRL